MAQLDKDTLAKLATPFDPSEIAWKPQAISKDQKRALAVAYIDARAVAERLDQVVGGGWEFDWEQVGTGAKGKLTIYGTTRCDVGEQGAGPQGKTLKAAVSDALKRSAVLFGIGRYLYRLPTQWVSYDARYKRLAELPVLPASAIPNGEQAVTGQPETPEPERPTQPEQPKADQPKQRSPGEERQAIAFAKMIYMRWNPMFPEDSEHKIFHTQFVVESAKDLSGVVDAANIIILLNIVDLGFQRGLKLDEILEALGISLLADWLTRGGSYDDGINLIGEYVDKQAQPDEADPDKDEVPF